jgi:chromosome partitioning related protein ParA
MAIKVTFVSTKGGVGKTTCSANLGAILADLGQRVLLVDADVQPSLSSYYPILERSSYGLAELITDATTTDVISKTGIQNLDVVVSNDPDGKLPNWLLYTLDGRVRLKHLLSRLDDAYDFIIIDTQGAVGPLQDAAVLAADLLVSPVPPEILSAREFCRGTLDMLDRLRPGAYMGAPVAPLKGLVYRQDRTLDAKRIVQELRTLSFGPSRGQITILDTAIPNTVAYREAATRQVPVHRWEPRRDGATPSARETMLALSHELFPHLADFTLPEHTRAAQAG